jgi:hypothetical protein|tara:strand:+ start:1199 stop:1498 length:300 start_codon:yes stop_codon:yes gene_type:complete
LPFQNGPALSFIGGSEKERTNGFLFLTSKKRERNKEKNAPVDAFEAIIEPRFGIFVHVFRFFGLERREQRESVRDREKFLVLFLGETKPRGRKKRSKNP